MQSQSSTLPAAVAKADVPSVYQWAAPVYDLWGRLTETHARNRCLEWAAIQDGEAVLEVAVGTGLAFAEILKRNPSGRNEGIDLTPAMLYRAMHRAARTGAKNYRLVLGDAYRLDYSDASFDLVVNNYMFDLLPEADFAHVLGEFRRVLRPGGRLVLVNMARGMCWYHGVWEQVYKINPAWMGGCRGVSLEDYAQAAGFQGIRRSFMSQMTFPSEVVYGHKPE